MIRADRVLLAELARVNTDVVALALRMMEGSATPAEQHHFAGRLRAVADGLARRAGDAERIVIDSAAEPTPVKPAR